jgi:hypothetical protein
MSGPVLPSNFDINKISYEPIKPIKSEGKSDKKQIFIKYNGQPLMIQTPFAVAPFGVAKSMEGDDWIMDVDLDNVDIDKIEDSKNFKQDVLSKKLSEFKDILKQIDTKNAEHLATQFGELWPNKRPKNADQIAEDVYGSLVKKPTDSKYSDKFRTKFTQPYINEKTKKKSFTVFGKDKKEIEWYNDNCMSAYNAPWNSAKMLVKSVVICTGLWIINEKVYCAFKALSITIRNPIAQDGFMFVKDDDEENEIVDDEIVKAAEVSLEPVVEKKLVVDEYEEEEFEDDDE